MFEQLTFILSCYFLIHVIVLGVELLFYKHSHHKKSWLLILILASIFAINFDFIYYYIGWYLGFPLLINVLVPVWFLIPPLYYHLIKIYLLDYKFKWFEYLHYFLFILIIYLIWPVYTWSPEYKLSIYLNVSNNGFRFSFIHSYLLIQILIYAVLTLFLIKKYKRKIQQTVSNTIQVEMVLIYRFLVVYMAYSVAMGLVIFVFPKTDQLKQFDSLDSLVLSSGVLLLVNWILQNRKKITTGKEIENIKINQDKYATSALSQAELKTIAFTLKDVVMGKELFRNCDLKISDLSEETGFKPHHISQALNQYLNKNFFDFINDFRVEAIKIAMEEGTALQYYSLIGLSMNYGFKSASSFYRIFKHKTGHTPGDYIKTKGRDC